MMLAFKEAHRLDANFEEWAADVVKGEEADEGCQGRASTRESGQSVIKSNFDLAGQLPSEVMSWPTHSLRSVRNSHFFNWKVTQCSRKTSHTHSNNKRREATTVDHKRMSSMIMRWPR
jgi:hypothetical protein